MNKVRVLVAKMFDHECGFSVGNVNQTDLRSVKTLSEEVKAISPKRSSTPAHVWQMGENENIQNLSRPSRNVFLAIANLFVKASHLLFQKVWVVESSANEAATTVLPFLPHFDRKRITKIMFYLIDVELKYGPMFIAKNIIPSFFEAKRKGATARGDNPVSDEYLEFLALTGKASHFHIFDTDTPHYAGRSFDGGMRQFNRFDFIHKDQ